MKLTIDDQMKVAQKINEIESLIKQLQKFLKTTELSYIAASELKGTIGLMEEQLAIFNEKADRMEIQRKGGVK